MTLAQIRLAVKELLIDTLSLDLTPEDIDDDMLLIGNLPEFDSMAIVSIITMLEESFSFAAADDELTAEVFESITSLVDFVSDQIKINQANNSN